VSAPHWHFIAESRHRPAVACLSPSKRLFHNMTVSIDVSSWHGASFRQANASQAKWLVYRLGEFN